MGASANEPQDSAPRLLLQGLRPSQESARDSAREAARDSALEDSGVQLGEEAEWEWERLEMDE